jgi:hypothetical protein
MNQTAKKASQNGQLNVRREKGKIWSHIRQKLAGGNAGEKGPAGVPLRPHQRIWLQP